MITKRNNLSKSSVYFLFKMGPLRWLFAQTWIDTIPLDHPDNSMLHVLLNSGSNRPFSLFLAHTLDRELVRTSPIMILSVSSNGILTTVVDWALSSFLSLWLLSIYVDWQVNFFEIWDRCSGLFYFMTIGWYRLLGLISRCFLDQNLPASGSVSTKFDFGRFRNKILLLNAYMVIIGRSFASLRRLGEDGITSSKGFLSRVIWVLGVYGLDIH